MTEKESLESLRHAKQIAVPEFGAETQRLLAGATVAIVGCGALGALQAELLTRMGVGSLRIADADIVSLGNLHRQLLFTERDAEEGLPKVAAATARLTTLSSRLSLHTVAERITRNNLASFIGEADLVLDATDNTATRFLLNDYCVRQALPWIYAGVSGVSGLVFPVLPQEGPCLRCLYPDPPGEDEAATCAVNGILPTTVALAVSLQVTQAVRVLNRTVKPGTLIRLNAWDASVRTAAVHRDAACPCCGLRRFDFLEAAAPDNRPPLASTVCSQRSVRIESDFWEEKPFEVQKALDAATRKGARVERKGLLWIINDGERRLSLFPDGHLLIQSCTDPDTALAAARALFR